MFHAAPTFEWLFSSMRPYMDLKGVRLGKSLATDCARERLLTSVHPHVNCEVARLTEWSRAVYALERFFSIVYAHVDSQGGGTHEHFLTYPTNQLLLFVLLTPLLFLRRLHMCCQRWYTIDTWKKHGVVITTERFICWSRGKSRGKLVCAMDVWQCGFWEVTVRVTNNKLTVTWDGHVWK